MTTSSFYQSWIRGASITVKLAMIGLLFVVLLLPTAWVTSLIEERESRADEAMKDITASWSGSQNLAGPVLVIPYRHIDTDDGKTRESVRKAFFLPSSLKVNGNIDPEVKRYGIYGTVVYTSALELAASFSSPDFEALNISPDDVLWDQASFVMSINNLGAIDSTPQFKLNGELLDTEPTAQTGVIIDEITDGRRRKETEAGVSSPVKLTPETDLSNVSVKLSLRGSDRLSLVPVARETQVTLTSPWATPSFDGSFLPRHEQGPEGFKATWKVLHFNRPFSQQFTDTTEKLTGADFGVRLLEPVEQYQMSMRTAKYAQLIILLTFAALFLVEMTQGIRIHPFQYSLVGAALIVYYTLLLSISEQLGFHTAYWIATGATIALVSLYAHSFFAKGRLVLLLSTLMSIFYAFIFVIIVQEDMSLLIGSIGLFIVLAAIMYFSRNIKWYGPSEPVTPA